MSLTATDNYSFPKPTVGGDLDVWGEETPEKLNEALDIIDETIFNLYTALDTAVSLVTSRIAAATAVDDAQDILQAAQLSDLTQLGSDITDLQVIYAALRVTYNNLLARTAVAETYELQTFVETFDDDGSWAPPDGIFHIDKLEIWGAGGKGSVNTGSSANMAGGGGGYSHIDDPVIPTGISFNIAKTTDGNSGQTVVSGDISLTADNGKAGIVRTAPEFAYGETPVRGTTAGTGGAGTTENGGDGSWNYKIPTSPGNPPSARRQNGQNTTNSGAGGGGSWDEVFGKGGNGTSINGGDGGRYDDQGDAPGGGGGADRSGSAKNGGTGRLRITYRAYAQ